MIKAGQFDRTFSVMAKTIAASAISDGQVLGNNSAAYTTVLTGWCKVEELSGSEPLEAGRTETRRARRFTMRFSLLIKPIHFILYDSRYYAIEHIEELGRREALQITAVETVAETY